MAALASPLIGPVLDRRGARMMLCTAVLVTGVSMMLLSLTQSLLAFYVFFCIARMNFAGPFDIGIYGALNSWFVERRALASSIVNLAQMVGLIVLPLIAHFAMQQQGWRAGWLAVGIAVLLVGFVPAWLLLVRRPEDVGLLPDGRAPDDPGRQRRPNCSAPRHRGAGVHAQTGAAHAGLLAAVALYGRRLSGAGGGEPAPGPAPDRARAEPDDRRNRGEHLLAGLGNRRASASGCSRGASACT